MPSVETMMIEPGNERINEASWNQSEDGYWR